MILSPETIKTLADNMSYLAVAITGLCAAVAGGVTVLLRAYLSARNALRGVVSAAAADPHVDDVKLVQDAKATLSLSEKMAVDSAVKQSEEPKP